MSPAPSSTGSPPGTLVVVAGSLVVVVLVVSSRDRTDAPPTAATTTTVTATTMAIALVRVPMGSPSPVGPTARLRSGHRAQGGSETRAPPRVIAGMGPWPLPPGYAGA